GGGGIVASDFVRAVGVLPGQERGTFGLRRFVRHLFETVVGGFALRRIADHRGAHEAPAAAAAPVREEPAEALSTGTMLSARKATPPRPSMVHGVATSLTTVTSCRLAILGSPAVVTLMTSAPVSSIATNSVTHSGAPVSRSDFCRPSLSCFGCGA